MLFGLPLEVVTMLGSSLFSGLMTMWGQSAKDRNDQFNNLIKAQQIGNDNQLKQLEKDKGFSWTRRILAIGVVMAAIGLLYAPALFGLPQIIELTSTTTGLFGLFTDSVTTFTPVDGFITPEWLKYSIFSIIGLYFGNSMVKR